MSNPVPAADKVRADENQEFGRQVEDGLVDADAGRVVSYDEVRRWLLSWGTEKELPPPECP